MRQEAYKSIQEQIIQNQMGEKSCAYVADQLQKFIGILKQESSQVSQKNQDQSFNNTDLQEIEKCIEKYVKLESNKKATIQTIQKLIKLTKEKKLCFLCK